MPKGFSLFNMIKAVIPGNILWIVNAEEKGLTNPADEVNRTVDFS